MTAFKFATKLATAAVEGLAPHVRGLYANPGRRIVAVVEVAHVFREEVAPDEDKEASVTLQIKHMEVAETNQEDALRQAMRALYTMRTVQGTLTEDQGVELSEETVRRCAGELSLIEAARLHTAIEHWAGYASAVLLNSKISASALRQEIRTIADGLRATIYADALVQG